jgi:hypothetical protein
MVKHPIVMEWSLQPSEKSSEEFVLRHWLTMGEIFDISEYELPDSRFVVETEGRLQPISIPTIPIPIERKIASLLVIILTLILVIHFLLYFQEARRTESFASRGTLFSVFQRSVFSKACFLLFAISPAVSAITLTLMRFSDS